MRRSETKWDKAPNLGSDFESDAFNRARPPLRSPASVPDGWMDGYRLDSKNAFRSRAASAASTPPRVATR